MNGPAVVAIQLVYEKDTPFARTDQEIWQLTRLFCPECGKKPVFMDPGPGDYYVGQDYVCATCGASFCLPTTVLPYNDIGHQRAKLLLESGVS